MAASAPPTPAGWTGLADRVWLASSPERTNVLLVAGARGYVLIDPTGTDGTPALPRGLEEPLVAVVVTHAHAGEQRDRPAVPVHAHEHAPLAAGTTVRALSSVAVVDLGDRVLELVHPGRAHTAGDLLVRLPEVDLLAVGGLAAGDGVPAYGPESFPLEWPAALDLAIGLTTPSTVVVPRRGDVLGRADLDAQRAAVGVVAETVADLASRGVGLDEALTAAAWPLPAERVREAVRRGYDQLPRTARRLPLL